MDFSRGNQNPPIESQYIENQSNRKQTGADGGGQEQDGGEQERTGADGSGRKQTKKE